MLMRTFRISLWLYCALLVLGVTARAQGGRQIASYKLPAQNSSGLIDVTFEYTPVFRIDQFEKSAAVLLNMNIKASRAQDLRGSFTYRYRYNGVEYTDQDLGFQVFHPIDIENLRLKVTIFGPDALIKTISWNKYMGSHIVLNVPGKHKASEFRAVLEGMESVSFKGTGPIHKAINDLLAAKRKKEQEARQPTTSYRTPPATGTAAGKSAQPASLAPSTTTAYGQRTAQPKPAAGGDDFWENGNRSAVPAGSSASGGIDRSQLPDLFMTTNGRYFRKDANNNLHELDYDGYQQLKREKAQAKAQQQEAQDAQARQARQQAYQKEADKAVNSLKQWQANEEASRAAWEQKRELQDQAFAAGVAKEEARKNLQATSTLAGNYSSVEQLMADFNQKMASVNAAVNNLTAQKNAQWNAAVSANFSEPEFQAYGQGLKVIGNAVNQAREAKERREAEERLRLQKEAMLRQMAAEEKRLLTGLRTDLFARFREGKVPLSSDKVAAATLYYFVYASDPAQLGAKQPTLYLSNVFPVHRYSDGSWPFKTTITTGLSGLTPYAEVMHGYYASAQEAEAMKQGLQDAFRQTGGVVRPVMYKGKTTTAAKAASSADFWETGKKKESTPQKKTATKDDFWNN